LQDNKYLLSLQNQAARARALQRSGNLVFRATARKKIAAEEGKGGRER
jgi:hypothetical protein